MQYLLLIYETEKARWGGTQSERDQMTGEYRTLVTEITETKHYLGGNALQPVATATSVRVRDGKTQVTDGPFAETREQLGGYFLIEAKDLDEATKIAARIPGARTGTVEVRPILPHTTM